MNIHVIEQEKFTDKFIDLIRNKYPLNSNIIYVYNGKPNLNKSTCVHYIYNFKEIDLTVLEKEDKLFIHAFYDRKLIRYLYSSLKKIKKNQLVLIAWGADIYDSRYLLMDNAIHFKVRFHEYLKKKIIQHTDLFMTFTCADIDVINEYYGGHGKQFDCLYPSNADIKLLDSLKKEKNDTKKIRILLGNSATPTNQHMQALDAMQGFASEKIEIVCPLSYGNKLYGQKVIEYGKKVYGDKFIPILSYMSPDEYSKLLNSVQVVVFNHNRQQATGNIEILAYLGKKIYLRSDSTTWKHYVVRDKCKFFDTIDIKDMSFDDFTCFSQEDALINEKYFRKIWDIDYIKSLWDTVMEYTG